MHIRVDSRKKKIVWIFLLVFPHLKPDSVVALWPVIERLYDIGRALSFFLVLMILIIKRKHRKTSVIWLIILMELWITFVTFLSGSQNAVTNLISFGSAIAIPLVIFCYSDSMDEVLTALFMNYEWLIYASLISVILYFPYGMYRSSDIGRPEYFLGNENGIIFFVLPSLFLALIRIKKTGKRLRGILLIIGCLVNLVVVWCVTGIVGLIIATIVVLAAFWRGKNVNYYVVLIGSILADILVSVTRIFDSSHFFGKIITDWFGKTLTLSGRTIIWDMAMPLIKDNLLFGLGRGNHIRTSRSYLYHAHNEYFQLLLVGGVPLLIIFLCILFCLGRCFSKSSSGYFVKTIALAMLTCLYIQFIATARVSYQLYVPLVLASFIPEIEASIVEYREKYNIDNLPKQKKLKR